VDDDLHRQPFAVDQGVDFAALHLLAGVVTHFVVFTAPLFRRFDRLAIENRSRWAGFAPHPLAQGSRWVRNL
jgi:hypothetical protein